jgi:hypothetical protein
MSLFTQRHYIVLADRCGKEIAAWQLKTEQVKTILSVFETFFIEDNSHFSESKFEKAVLTSASKHGWSPDKEEVMS